MKSFLYVLPCVALAFTLSLSGCADQARTAPRTVSQKGAASQTPTYKPYYQSKDDSANVAPLAFHSPPVVTSVAPPPPSKFSEVNTKAKAAILLPLSGKNAALGQAMLNAAQQAVFDAAGTNFELQPRDTAGEGGAAEAARAALSNGAQLIIGPLFATDVPSVKAVVQNEGLQMLPLSTDTSLAEPGVYVMGLAPGAQVERVVAYAVSHGAHNFAALTPVTPYGVLVNQIFATSVVRYGGSVVDSQTYEVASRDAGIRAKVLAAQRDHIDALFLPESGNELKLIADQLTAAGFDPAHVHVLGTGLWDVPNLGRQNSLLLGGWYAAPNPEARHAFVQTYAAAYGQEPPRLATLAYDATALAAVLAKHGISFDEQALTNPNGFAGLDGIFRLTQSGSVERALAVNETTQDGARVIDPPPTSFVGKNALR